MEELFFLKPRSTGIIKNTKCWENSAVQGAVVERKTALAFWANKPSSELILIYKSKTIDIV